MCLLCGLLYALFFPTLCAAEVQYTVQHYSVADGLPQNIVMSVIQDRDGFIWAGTWDGLCRFDGYTFKTYKPAQPLCNAGSNRIDRLYADSSDYIWMQTNDGSFYRLDKHSEQIVNPGVRDIRFGTRATSKPLFYEERKGVVWLAGDNNVVCVREQEKESVGPVIVRYNLHGVANFVCGTTDGVWVGTNSGLEHVRGLEQKSFSPSAKQGNNDFCAGTSYAGVMLFGTSAGELWKASGDRLEKMRCSVHSAVTDMIVLRDSLLVVTSEADGLTVCDLVSGNVRTFSSSTRNDITSDMFSSLYADHRDNVWCINGQNGVWRYSVSDNTLRHYTADQDTRYKDLLTGNFFAFEDPWGRLWLNPQGGGFSVYNTGKDKLDPLPGVTNMIHSAFIDRNGSMWVGSYDHGLDRIDAEPERFVLTDMRDNNSQGEVRAACQLHNGDILLATKNRVVSRYDSAMNFIRRELTGKQVYSILETEDGTVYYGTKGNGVIVHCDGKSTSFVHNDNDRFSLSSDNVYDILKADSVLFIATYGGGVNVLRNGRFFNSSNDWNTYPESFGAKVRQLAMVNDSSLWAATTDGLLTINTRTFATACHPYSDVRAISVTSDGHAWLGTFGGGLVEIRDCSASDLFASGNIRVLDHGNGMLSDIVLAVVTDAGEDLWLTYEDGVSHYNRTDGGIQHFNTFKGDQSAHFGEAKALRLADGSVFFGYSEGVCRFLPDNIFVSQKAPKMVLVKFTLAGEEVTAGEDSPLTDNILYADAVTLSHNQNFFSIDYAAIDFSAADNILYAYMLEGVDTEWNYVGHGRRATYTRLAPGHYTFRVRSTNANGVWADSERVLVIHIRPSFWATPWAAMFYLIVIVIIILTIYRNINTNTRLKQEIEVEQKVTDIKLRFFTNISHELRTPLTLISGPVDNILQTEDIPPSVRSQLEIVNSNASRMLRLVNQILDFRKIQNNKMRLSVREINLTELAKNVIANFMKEAADKHINLCFEDNAPDTMVWVDRDKLDIIIYNLLSNAFKFTPAAGTVTLRLMKKNNYALVQVEDTGIGIPKEQRSVLFERFSSHNVINGSEDKPGTGIGLNLVKELVNLHHGFIEVESEPGKGTTFTVMLRFGREHYGQEADIITAAPNVSDTSSELSLQEKTDMPFDPGKKTLLVVDDNSDMRSYLQSILSPDYNVFLASDGKEALDVAAHHNVELVVSDLMMPNMDGLELTNCLKSNTPTSHLPVILLTAKSAIESRLEALRYGADDYITKPFSAQYLIARVDNILRQRDRLQETYRAMILLTDNNAAPQSPAMSPDEIFLHKLHNFMLSNLDNNALAVDDLVKEMALGRTVFFNKLKNLTGLSPVEYIRDIRLRHAAELLLDDRYNITDVTYMVGMNDSRYFSKCFKAVYGLTPTEYRKQHHAAGKKE